MSAPSVKTPKLRHLALTGLIVIVAAGTIVTNGLVSRARTEQELVKWTNAQAVPTVALAALSRGNAEQSLVLPGNIQPYYKAAVYARVNGYLSSWSKDIGAQVKAGEVLASIDAPDLDQQLAQAKATLVSAKANYDIAQLTNSRESGLAKKQAVAQQVADQAAADADAKKAIMDADAANVRQLEAMQSFKQIVAPFDGIVTARNTDVGALINAGRTAGQQLFEVSDLHSVRIYIQVPQTYSANLRPGLKASFELPQYPGQKFDADVVTMSNAMDATSRSMLLELHADNPDGKLLSNSYCRVELHIPSDQNQVRVPATALIPVAGGVQVAVLGDGGKAVLKTVQLGRDFGDSVEVTAGLASQDKVIDRPPETLRDGDLVAIAPSTVPPSAAQVAIPTSPTKRD
jgi:RND family efflux transporter MFP subunit